MTSLKSTADFADLSPEQRQALFDKLRQRKLTNARRPSTAPALLAADKTIALSPVQQECLRRAADAPLTNRVLELVIDGSLDCTRLQHNLQLLIERHTGLSVRFDRNAARFVAADSNATLQVVATGDLTQLRAELTRSESHQPSLRTAFCQVDEHEARLLLAVHPLLLDTYSLLRFANQWLSLTVGNLDLEKIPSVDGSAFNNFAHWSTQVLEQKFLSQEWSRLKPKSLDENDRVQPCVPANPGHESLFLATDFINQHLTEDESIKSWIGDAVHRCLSSWLSHQEVLYWYNAPLMRDDQFESLLGYFPYYVPVTGLTAEREKESQAAGQRINRLQTRFSPVSEQLSLELSRRGTNAPLIHYHWFDLDSGENIRINVKSVIHHQQGFQLAPVEIHITELVDGVAVDVHYDQSFIGLDQVNFLLRDLMVYLREEKEIESNARPSLHDSLRKIWKDLLQKSEIGDDQSFFELGGHSLQVTELKFRIKQQLKLDLPISVLYELSTINQLVNFILATHSGGLGFAPTDNDADAGDEEEGTL